MRQFYTFKEKHPDKILFFRMGDFYEMFAEDAIKAAPILEVALTSRSQGGGEKVPLAGVPHHAADKYLARLVAAGEKVVIVEQVEDPRTAKGLVKRDVVEILTPGTAVISGTDSGHRPATLASICFDKRDRAGLALLDLSTGTFRVDEGPGLEIVERLKLVNPSEVLYSSDIEADTMARRLGMQNSASTLTPFESFNFDYRSAHRDLLTHFEIATLEGFGVDRLKLAITAAGAVFRYLKENHQDRLSHIIRLSGFDHDQQMMLDHSTVRNLELVQSTSTGGEVNSLFSVMNLCHTAGGARQLRESLLRPFKTKPAIERRLSGVAELVNNRDRCYQLRELTKKLPDLERLAGRLGLGRLSPRQMAGIKEALQRGGEIAAILTEAHSPHLSALASAMPDMADLISHLENALIDDPPLVTNKGDIFKRGYSTELDDLNDSIRGARLYIGSLQEKEREQTGISSLKVGFNKVFGYYIEVTKVNSGSVPEHYIRKQTLVNAERYITPELKEKEELILGAEEKIFKLQADLYAKLVDYLNGYISDIVLTAHLLSELDLVSALADLAVQRGYCRPEINEGTRLVIREGRHPVIESVLPPGSFVANDVDLSVDDQRIQILTGPNMSGKSTYLRQIGLITIMAQIGSFVPAASVEVGLVDRVFTRVGAIDNLAGGQSTFLVEMVETANILNNATDRSLVLLDEVGRGTSTFDGLSVAWAVGEQIDESNKSRTVFATHYHELTGMAEQSPYVHNFQVSVKRWEDRVIFLHKIVPGGCDDSFGIEVARLAGLPRSAITRAKQILKLLESGKFTQSELGRRIFLDKVQPSLFDPAPSATEDAIRDLDVDSMTPIEALNLLKKPKEELP